MYVGVCVCIRAHTHTARGVLECKSRGRDETLGEPEESRLIQLVNLGIDMSVYVYKIYMYTLGGGIRS